MFVNGILHYFWMESNATYLCVCVCVSQSGATFLENTGSDCAIRHHLHVTALHFVYIFWNDWWLSFISDWNLTNWLLWFTQSWLCIFKLCKYMFTFTSFTVLGLKKKTAVNVRTVQEYNYLTDRLHNQFFDDHKLLFPTNKHIYISHNWYILFCWNMFCIKCLHFQTNKSNEPTMQLNSFISQIRH